MATNTLAGMGLLLSRNLYGAAPTLQANFYTIQKGYSTAIGIGDVVKTGTSSAQGYVVLGAHSDTQTLGVFAGVAHPGYYDTSLQAQAWGLNGSWPTTANPISDVAVLVIDSPMTVFRAQVSGGPWQPSWRGQNISWLAGTNGAPNASGISTLVLDGANIGTGNTLPFRIIGLAGVTGGPQDPANVNPWIEVTLNTSEILAPTGI